MESRYSSMHNCTVTQEYQSACTPCVVTPRPPHLLNGQVCSLLCLKVHKAVALGLASGVVGHLAGQDDAKLAEGVVQGLVVNGLVQVL